MTSRKDSPGRITMPGVPADSGVSFGNEVLGAYMRIGLSNSCTSRPALYTESMSGADARTRTRSGVNRKSSALIDTVCIDPSHARRAATTRPKITVLPFTEMSRAILFRDHLRRLDCDNCTTHINIFDRSRVLRPLCLRSLTVSRRRTSLAANRLALWGICGPSWRV